MQEQIQAVAERRYDAYIRQSGGLNYQGKPCPQWDKLPLNIQQNWIAVVDDERKDAMGADYVAPHPDVLPAVDLDAFEVTD